jgi:hypothetical protein
MTIQQAFNDGVFGIPCDQLRILIQNTPKDILKKTFEIWSKSKIEYLKSNINDENKMIELIERGLEQ